MISTILFIFLNFISFLIFFSFPEWTYYHFFSFMLNKESNNVTQILWYFRIMEKTFIFFHHGKFALNFELVIDNCIKCVINWNFLLQKFRYDYNYAFSMVIFLTQTITKFFPTQSFSSHSYLQKRERHQFISF